MESLFVAVVVGVAVYVAGIMMIPRKMMADSERYTRQMLERLSQDNEDLQRDEPLEYTSILKDAMEESNALGRVFFTLPGADRAYALMLKAGIGRSINVFFLSMMIVFFVLLFMALKLGMAVWSIFLAIALTYFLGWRYLKHRIKKRNDAFLNMFPDALDTIVRGVKSGYPLQTSIKMIADNLQPPVSTEFKQISDDTSYGRSLIESLQRMALRIDEPDIRFFIVVLTVQHESGGNLAEVLTNLADVIRKRKQLRLKVKALTSEGRTTAWILGLLPVFVFTVIYLRTPDHLTPLFTTETGRMVLYVALGLMGFGAWIVRQMIQVKV